MTDHAHETNDGDLTGSHDDPRLEVLQAVYDRVSSYEESAPADQIRLCTPDHAARRGDRKQSAGQDRFVGPLDSYPLGFGQQSGVLDESCRRL